MILGQALRRLAIERKLALDLIEKDYALGWVLKGISSTSASDKLVFKGGTALSKIFYPMQWRISEDLDFTVINNANFEDLWSRLQNELSNTVMEESGGITLQLGKLYILPDFLRATVTMTGPITRHRTKIEFTREAFLGEYDIINVPAIYDTPTYNLQTYTLNNILAEKLRTLVERSKIRDYYDVWKLLRLKSTDTATVKELFKGKCLAKGLTPVSFNIAFPENLAETLEPYLDTLTRFTTEALPPLDLMLGETKALVEQNFPEFLGINS